MGRAETSLYRDESRMFHSQRSHPLHLLPLCRTSLSVWAVLKLGMNVLWSGNCSQVFEKHNRLLPGDAPMLRRCSLWCRISVLISSFCSPINVLFPWWWMEPKDRICPFWHTVLLLLGTPGSPVSSCTRSTDGYSCHLVYSMSVTRMWACYQYIQNCP